MRTAVASIVCFALGFGAAWLLFEKPWRSGPPPGPSSSEVEIQVARQLAKNPDTVTCSPSEKVPGRWYCSYPAEKDAFVCLPGAAQVHVDGRNVSIQSR